MKNELICPRSTALPCENRSVYLALGEQVTCMHEILNVAWKSNAQRCFLLFARSSSSVEHVDLILFSGGVLPFCALAQVYFVFGPVFVPN